MAINRGDKVKHRNGQIGVAITGEERGLVHVRIGPTSSAAWGVDDTTVLQAAAGLSNTGTSRKATRKAKRSVKGKGGKK